MNLRTNDVLEDLKTYEDYFFNTIITDPPYNLSSQWYIAEDGSYQMKGKSNDFMGKWSNIDGPSLDTFFKESFRVMKYGGYLLVFGLDRQLGPLHYYAVKNGFEVNQSLYWYFVSNFPKATDAGKMIDKRLKKDREVVGEINDGRKGNNRGHKKEFVGSEGSGSQQYTQITEPASDLAKVFDGYKYSKAPLKQMVETIMVFSKPTKNKSVLDDIMEWGESVDLLNYCPKVSKKERNMGLDNEPDKETGNKGLQKSTNRPDGSERKEVLTKNTHPTLKPINLIYEISKLFKLPEIVDQKVYVPFMGSGSEVIGLLKAGYNHKNIWGCEMNEEYVEIAKKRIKYYYDTNKPEGDGGSTE